MKRIMILLVGAMFLLGANAMAAQNKTTHRGAMGKITAMTHTSLTIVRLAKGTAENMEFVLSKRLAKTFEKRFRVGEIVRVVYIEKKDGKKIAIGVYRRVIKKRKK